jgi:phosphatidate cytidylyltransferase
MTVADEKPELRPLVPAFLRSGDLLMRVLSTAVMIPVAVIIAWLGGGVFIAFWCAIAIVIFIEWTRICVPRDRVVVQAAGAIICAIGAALLSRHSPAVSIVLGAGVVLTLVFASGARLWAALGLIYAFGLLAAVTILRSDDNPYLGLIAIFFLFAIVWATDIVGYFVGRIIGGPKLWPAVSPKKTWSGASGAVVAGGAAALAVAGIAEIPDPTPIVALGVALSIVSQCGDLAESAFKRHFAVKDASHLIPGHGGLMDRLDGFTFAAISAAVLGVLHYSAVEGGARALEGAARGLLLW